MGKHENPHSRLAENPQEANEIQQKLEELDAKGIDRRKLALALLGGAAVVAGGVGSQPKEVQAQLFGDFSLSGLLDIIIEGGTTSINDTIREPIDVTREITEAAFSFFRALGIPSSVIALLNQLLGLTGGAGDHSMTIPDRIPTAMEISWPEVPPRTSDDMMEQGALTSWATRERVREASSVAAATVAGQAQLAQDEALLIDEANAAAAEGNVTTILLAMANLQVITSQKLTQQIAMQNQLIALTGDAAVREQAGRWLGPQAGQRALEPVPEVLQPLPVQVP